MPSIQKTEYLCTTSTFFRGTSCIAGKKYLFPPGVKVPKHFTAIRHILLGEEEAVPAEPSEATPGDALEMEIQAKNAAEAKDKAADTDDGTQDKDNEPEGQEDDQDAQDEGDGPDDGTGPAPGDPAAEALARVKGAKDQADQAAEKDRLHKFLAEKGEPAHPNTGVKNLRKKAAELGYTE